MCGGLLGRFDHAALARLEIFHGFVLLSHGWDVGAPAGFHPAADAAGIGKVGVLAERVENHQSDRAIAHFRHQNQAMPGGVGKAGFSDLDVPVGFIDQVIGITETRV